MINKLLNLINRGIVQWKSWKTVYPDAGVYDDTITWSDTNQGEVGNCYLIAAMGAVAEFP